MTVVGSLRRIRSALRRQLGAAREPPGHQDGEDFRQLTEAAGDVISCVGLDGVNRYVSPAIRELLGWEPEDRIGRPAIELVHPEDRNRLAATVREVIRSGESRLVEYRMQHARGHWVRVSGHVRGALHPETGRVTETVVVTRDASQPRADWESIRERERRYRLLAENSSDVIASVGMDGRTTYTSPAAREVLGHEPEALDGRLVIDFVHPEDRLLVEDSVRAVLRSKEPCAFEYRVRRGDGSYVWVETTLRGVPEPESDRFHEVITVTRDVTRRHEAEAALREGEARMRATLQAQPDLIFVIDRDHRCVDLFAHRPEDLIAPPEQLLSRTLSEVLPEEVARVADRAVAAVLASGEPRTQDFALPSAAGERDYEARLVPLGPDQVVAVVRDVTHARESEAALRESEARARAILEAQPDLMFVVDREHRFTDFFAHRREDLYAPPEQFLGRTVVEVLPEAAAVIADRMVTLVLESGELRVAEYSLPLAGGERDFEARFAPLGPDRVVVVARNVTHARESEAALRESEARARAILEAQPELMFIFDRDGRYLEVFGAERDVRLARLGVTEGSSISDVFPEELARYFLHGIREVIRSGEPRRDEVPVEVAGEIRHYESSSVPLGRDRVLVTARDVTERRRAEEERAKLEAAMRHTQKLESLGLMAGQIAHDFNNLLTSVLGNASLALEQLPEDSPAREGIEQVGLAGERAEELTRQLLAYAGRAEAAARPVDLSELVRELSPLLAPLIADRGALEQELAGGLPAVEADPAQLHQVVMNLVSNAGQALDDGVGEIRIRTALVDATAHELEGAAFAGDRSPGPRVLLEVSDTGEGMDEGTAARAFDPFFTRRENGRGLGLATVAGVARSQGAAIFLDTRPGAGTRVRILFPVSSGSAESAVLHPEPGSVSERALSGGVLVVDDDEAIRRLARRCLERAGLRVLAAEDGRRAVEIFAERADEVVAVLLDWSMPHLRGDETFRELRRIRAEIPVLLSSGLVGESSVSEFMRRGPTRFLAKPYTASELVGALRALVDRSGPASPA